MHTPIPPTPDEEMVESVVRRYVTAVADRDIATLRESVFRDDATMWGYLGEALVVAPLDTFFGVVASDPPDGSMPVNMAPAGTWESSYSDRIRGIEVTGDVAVAVLEEHGYRGLNFVNYFSLVREADVWRIATKVFTTSPTTEQ